MSKKKKEVFQITLKGLIYSISKDENLTNEIIDGIELHLRRNFSKKGHPAIVFDLDQNKFHFITLEKEK